MLQSNAELVIVLVCTVQWFTLAINISGAHVNCHKLVDFPTFGHIFKCPELLQ